MSKLIGKKGTLKVGGNAGDLALMGFKKGDEVGIVGDDTIGHPNYRLKVSNGLGRYGYCSRQQIIIHRK